MLILPPSRAFMAILKPSPSLAILLAAGILTLSKETRAVGWMVHPILSSFFPNAIPLASPGTIKADTSFSDVFAMTIQRLLKLPPEINIFDPLSTYYSPSFLANDFIALESDPLSGSVRQQLENAYMLMSPGRYLAFCYSLPNSSIIQVHILWIVRYAVVGTQPVASAQKMTEAYSRDRPVPLLAQIAEYPICAASLKTSTGKYSFFSHSIAYGLNFFFAKSKACVLRSSRSLPMLLSQNLYMPSQICDQSCTPYLVVFNKLVRLLFLLIVFCTKVEAILFMSINYNQPNMQCNNWEY